MKKALALSLALAAPLSWAESLTVPLEFQFLGLNGTAISPSLFSHKESLDLDPGENKIAIKYLDVKEEISGDGHAKIASEPFVITLNVESGISYKLEPTVSIDDLNDAEAYALSPKVKITSSRGKNVDFSLALTKSPNPNKSLIERITGTGKPKQSAVVAATATTAPATAIKPAPQTNNANPQAESMLKYWWEQADEQTRKAFMSWAVQQL